MKYSYFTKVVYVHYWANCGYTKALVGYKERATNDIISTDFNMNYIPRKNSKFIGLDGKIYVVVDIVPDMRDTTIYVFCNTEEESTLI